MAKENKLSLFAENATVATTESSSETVGYVYNDITWRSNTTRASGEKTGKASSQRFNTALRQACFGSKLLGDLLVARYGGTIEGFSDILSYNITTDTENNVTMSTIISDITSKLTTDGNFVRDNEITASKIKSGEIINRHIATNAISLSSMESAFSNSFTADGSTYKANKSTLSDITDTIQVIAVGTLGSAITMNIKMPDNTTKALAFYWG